MPEIVVEGGGQVDDGALSFYFWKNPVRLTMESGSSNYCTSFYSLGQNNVIPLKRYKITN